MEVEKRKKNKKSDDIYPEQAIDSDDDRSTNNDQLLNKYVFLFSYARKYADNRGFHLPIIGTRFILKCR
jgi:hypothetical protein